MLYISFLLFIYFITVSLYFLISLTYFNYPSISPPENSLLNKDI